ncbi:hypothetical protein [Cupriavidus basilensis]|uniref:hypothetical protein n=1 Tax=Cupriavidus basilensis TaxID=68895 RepID=UPI00157AE91D|nr:hypothetical protein [Cupriavidus basilensis]NUA26140.1 hypothetical protein [Cupriavidus basilensis]
MATLTSAATPVNTYTYDLRLIAKDFIAPLIWPESKVRRAAFDSVELVLAQQQIRTLSALEDDWDGYGAVPVHPETISNAVGAARSLEKVVGLADIYPNPNGTISLEWESAAGYAYLEVGRTRFSFYVKPLNGKTVSADGKANDISPVLGDLVSERLFPARQTSCPVTDISIPGIELRFSRAY